MLKRSFMLILMVAVLFVACDVTGGSTINKSRLPELRLVSVGSDVFSKSNVPAGADINFGDVLATEKLYYLIENSGEIPVFNVSLSTTKDSIEISPSSIGTINPEGYAISTTPILSIICPHVIPISGVGSLMPMTVGELSDSIFINYQFIAPFDSVGVWEEGDTIDAQPAIYSLSAVKKGIVLEPWVNDVILWESTEYDRYSFSTFVESFYVRYYDPDSTLDFRIYNKGNVEIPYEMLIKRNIRSYYTFTDSNETYLSDKIHIDTLIYNYSLLPDEYFDLSILNDIYYNSPIVTDSTYRAYFTFYFHFTPTPYLIGLKDKTYLNGWFEFKVYTYFTDLFNLNS